MCFNICLVALTHVAYICGNVAYICSCAGNISFVLSNNPFTKDGINISFDTYILNSMKKIAILKNRSFSSDFQLMLSVAFVHVIGYSEREWRMLQYSDTQMNLLNAMILEIVFFLSILFIKISTIPLQYAYYL